jgi:hypothetical protein
MAFFYDRLVAESFEFEVVRFEFSAFPCSQFAQAVF